MPAKETGKQRAIRIPLDYFRHGDRLQRGKAFLGIVALVASVAWVGAGFWQGERQYSRGPVTAVHAAWADDCQACHVPFTPIRGSGWTAPLLGHSKESSERCQACHAGPPHHQGQKPDLACAECHHDHQGRSASLVRLSDSDCTRCHADMDNHLEGVKPRFKKDITVFAERSHPDFRSVPKEDPGRLKFNHAVHLAAGLSVEKGGKPFTLGDIAAAERERYRREQGSENKAGDQVAVQLQCASCHRLDSGDFGEGPGQARPARDAGAYMRPITYENQCRGCHPLTLKGPKTGSDLTIPHRLQPEQVRNFLWGALAHQQLEMRPWSQTSNRPLPGKRISEQVENQVKEDIEKKVEQFLYKDKLAEAEKVLYWGKQTCGECHHYTSAASPVPAAIVPPRVPDVWYQHARFNHAAHKAVACTSCHAKAETSPKASDVLIPKIDNCVQCHAQRTTEAGKIKGGVEFGCTECHSYHHRDRDSAFLQGMGAKAREPGARVTINEFLGGHGRRPQK